MILQVFVSSHLIFFLFVRACFFFFVFVFLVLVSCVRVHVSSHLTALLLSPGIFT